MSALELDAIAKTYGSGPDAFEAIQNVTVSAGQGEMLCIVGPSGCGKTTLLRCTAGLLAPTAGTVRVGDEIITRTPRSMAVVFQDYSRSLLPWLDLHRNVTMPLEVRRVPKVERDRLAAEALESVGLGPDAHKYPWQLSGG
ncbi:MAG: ATP-binding cassette domain-containing protein, partial [Acidimicrobiales bacterium]